MIITLFYCVQLYRSLAGFLVTRRDDSVMFFHPTFREWLIRGAERFTCDPRTGHAAIALRMARLEAPLSPAATLELCHHILKGHLYRSAAPGLLAARDLQASWVSQATEDPSLALVLPAHLASPSPGLARLLLLAGAAPDTLVQEGSQGEPVPVVAAMAARGLTDMVALLLEFGANIQVTTLECGFLAL